MGKIFISYAKEDISLAKELYETLDRQGFSLWMDEEDLLPGYQWEIEIEKAIHESDIFIACLSKNSVNKRGYVQAELKKALDVANLMPEGEVYIIPVRLDACEVPRSLSKLHWLNYFEPGEKEKLYKAIRQRIESSVKVVSKQETYFDAGERVKIVREELGLKTSEFVELLGVSRQREYEAMEMREKEIPVSLLKIVSDFSGVNIEWLKHEKQPGYEVEAIYLNPIQKDLEFCASLNPREYYITLEKKSLHVGLVVQTGEYFYKVIETGITLDFWKWVESYWAIPAFYHFLRALSDPWHDINGVIIPSAYDKKLFKGEIHFLSAARNAGRFGRNLLYDLLDLNETRSSISDYSRIYGGSWMPRVHDYWKTYLQEEKQKRNQKRTKEIISNPTETNLIIEFELALRETYDIARRHGYPANYFLQMLEEYGGVETAKRLLVKSEPQEGLFKLWDLGLLKNSMEAVVVDEKFRSLFSAEQIAEARRRLEELGYTSQ